MSLADSVRRMRARAATDTSTDAELVRRFATARDEAAFAELVARHGPLVSGVCRRVLGHAHDAEDAAQAVFLVLARHATKVRNQASVASWLHGVAVRVCRKALARRAKRTATALPDTPAPPDADAVTWADARRSIDAALAALPESLRLPLVLCYLQGQTRDEAAERLGWSVSTLRGRLERGRERLRGELVRRGFPLSAALVGVLLCEPAAAAERFVVHRPASPSVVSLAHGVVPAMKTWMLAAALAVLVVVYAATGQKKSETPPVPKPAERLLKPDPKSPPLDKKFAGLWTARQDAPDGVFRVHDLRFVDGEHLVWVVTQHSPGVRSSVTTRSRYEFKGGELRLHVLEKFAGEERLPLRPDDKNPRVYSFAWLTPQQSPDRASFELKATAAPDSPWAVTKFARSQEAAGVPDPLVPEYLTGIDRGIKKEPKYLGPPLYLLLAFGPDAKARVWVVLDGSVLYVDRNGNGDLTDDGVCTPLNATDNPRSPAFQIGDITAGGAKHTDAFLSAIRTQTGGVFAKLGVRVGGKTLQMAGPTDLRLTESAKDARVLHFGSTVLTAIPSRTMPSVPDANRPDDFRVQVGTPGVGGGAFVAFSSEQLPAGVAPVAEFEFDPTAGGPAKKVTVNLSERCCGDQFFAKVTVPDGVKTGLNAARVTLTFPNCPWGAVAPATHAIDVLPKRKP